MRASNETIITRDDMSRSHVFPQVDMLIDPSSRFPMKDTLTGNVKESSSFNKTLMFAYRC